MTVVRFERHGDQYTVAFRYDANLVDLVKTIPAYARSWNSVTREWVVDSSYAVWLAGAMRQFGHNVTGIIEPPRAPRAQQHRDNTTNWARLLFVAVGRDRAEPVFRALTRILHPDNPATGDAQLQLDLNNARDELRA
jgi:hypothetical protein